MKNILVLGGGYQQLYLIELIKKYGHKVYLADYSDYCPGEKIADHAKKISTFSVEECLEYAKEINAQRVITNGTDQPVYTAAKVSEALNLPHPISSKQALYFTHKSYMKDKLMSAGIPTPNYLVLKDINKLDFDLLRFPFVVKPVDSQGQRGVHLIQSYEKNYFDDRLKDALSFSRSKEVILEEYYAGEEVTANCWVKDGISYNIMINERIHFNDNILLGLCQQHIYPSGSVIDKGVEKDILNIVQRIVHAFEISNGPLYVQLIVGSEGAKVIEFGYRIGGGFESSFIPKMKAFNILDAYFNLIVNKNNNFNVADINPRFTHGSINFLLGKPGIIQKTIIPENMDGKIFLSQYDEITNIKSAASRIGYFIILANSREEYLEKLKYVDENLHIYDVHGNDLLYHGIYL
ncbi:ATP-grasp domain-containing protein [Legionella israelensis]|uniref:ATP-grasp domain-containing protein n=1 Tax=Legionella israelensis TaxID=454 RepID=UPI00117EAAC0|nr:ATP-grasp domain-containing protein [Legionella israelensis]QDP72379.1 ATP-grasp domain-containing protein [Legionella israelensis]